MSAPPGRCRTPSSCSYPPSLILCPRLRDVSVYPDDAHVLTSSSSCARTGTCVLKTHTFLWTRAQSLHHYYIGRHTNTLRGRCFSRLGSRPRRVSERYKERAHAEVRTIRRSSADYTERTDCRKERPTLSRRCDAALRALMPAYCMLRFLPPLPLSPPPTHCSSALSISLLRRLFGGHHVRSAAAYIYQ